MPVRVPAKEFERLIGSCEKAVQDQFKTYRPAIRSKLTKAFEVWKNLPEDAFFARKIENEMASIMKNADRFVIMLRQVDLLEDAGKGVKGAILFRKKEADDIDVVTTIVLGTGKMKAWTSKEKQAQKRSPKDLGKSPSEGEEAAVESAEAPSEREEGDESFGKASPAQLVGATQESEARPELDEFDEARDEWRVFQRLFPNLGKKEFYRISFKNRFGEEL